MVLVTRAARPFRAALRASGGGEAVEEDEPLHIVDHIRHADLHPGAGDADSADEEIHLFLPDCKHMLDAGAHLGLERVGASRCLRQPWRYVALRIVEVAIPRNLFAGIPRLIAELRRTAGARNAAGSIVDALASLPNQIKRFGGANGLHSRLTGQERAEIRDGAGICWEPYRVLTWGGRTTGLRSQAITCSRPSGDVQKC